MENCFGRIQNNSLQFTFIMDDLNEILLNDNYYNQNKFLFDIFYKR